MKFIFFLLSSLSFAQTYSILNESKADVSFRGLAFESPTTFIISGSKNTIGKTTDGGKTFQWINPNIVKNRDFRDIEVLDKNNYLAMSIDAPAYILITNDGGKTWAKAYENNQKGVFLDALYVDKKGKKIYALGDPIEKGKPFVLTASFSDPKKWEYTKTIFNQATRLKKPNEAFFAASGSNIYADDKQVLIVSGGAGSNVYRYTPKGGQMYNIDSSTVPTAGVNGMSYDPLLNIGFLVGGDYTKPNDSKNNLFKFSIVNNQLQFDNLWKYPKGYKSDVAIIDKNKILVCGYSGVDYTADGGFNWKTITKDSYNTCQLSPDKKSIILVGNKGKIGKIVL